MRHECRKCFPLHRLEKKPPVSDQGMHHGTCVTHVPWCMSGSLTRENVPGIPGTCATHNFMYLARGPWLSKMSPNQGNALHTSHIIYQPPIQINLEENPLFYRQQPCTYWPPNAHVHYRGELLIIRHGPDTIRLLPCITWIRPNSWEKLTQTSLNLARNWRYKILTIIVIATTIMTIIKIITHYVRNEWTT